MTTLAALVEQRNAALWLAAASEPFANLPPHTFEGTILRVDPIARALIAELRHVGRPFRVVDGGRLVVKIR